MSAAAAGALAVGALPLLVTPGGNVPDTGTGKHFHGNVRKLLPHYRLPLAVSAVGLGAAVMRSDWKDERHQLALLLTAAWLVPPSLAAILYGAGADLPLMRFFGITFPLPLLAATLLAAIVAAASRVAGWSRIPAITIATMLVVASLVWSALIAKDLTGTTSPSITPAELEPIRAAVAYADRVDASALVIVVSGNPGRAFRRVRMLAPARLIPRTGVFVGTPAALFDRVNAAEGAKPPPGLEGVELKNALISADGVERMRMPGAVALALAPFLDDPAVVASDPAHAEIAEGVFVLGDGRRSSSQATEPLKVQPLSAPPPTRLIRDAAVAFVALLAAGIGWALALVPAPLDVRIALAPCLGLAGVLLLGTVSGLAGVPLGGGMGMLLLGSVAAAGGYSAFLRNTRTRSPSRSDRGRT